MRSGETVASGTPSPTRPRRLSTACSRHSVAARMGARFIRSRSGTNEYPMHQFSVAAGWASTETGALRVRRSMRPAIVRWRRTALWASR